jgi:hypothetical protein
MEYTPINEKKEGDCGYICTFNGQQVALYANGLYAAKKAAIAHFKPRRSQEHMVTPYLCEKEDGSQYIQPTSF